MPEPEFPDPETDERLRAPAVPEPPKVAYERPRPKPETVRGPRGLSMNAVDARGMGAGWSVATSLMSSLVAGVLLGMALDRWVIRAATPWGLIVGFLLGCVSGFANLFASAARLNREEEEARRRGG